jgi:hypothetical protein
MSDRRILTDASPNLSTYDQEHQIVFRGVGMKDKCVIYGDAMPFWSEAEARQYIADTYSGMVNRFIHSVVT